MRAQKVEMSDLLPGFVRAEQGGVVRLAELQGLRLPQAVNVPRRSAESVRE